MEKKRSNLGLCSLAASFGTLAVACQPQNVDSDPPEVPAALDASKVVIAAPDGAVRPPFKFSPEDEELLDRVQHGAFLYLWHEASPTTGMVHDRSSRKIVSVAGVGFQLAALPVAVERSWISRDEARTRAELILTSLSSNPGNRHAGLFFHYLDQTGAVASDGYEHVVSTIDSAILLAGMITASEYFGGEVSRLADPMVAAADWRSFVRICPEKPHESNFISLGWRADDRDVPGDQSGLLPYSWMDCGDEHRLVTFLAVAAPDPEHRVEPEMYFRLRRALGSFQDTGPIAYFPWSGALFTNFFASCWIDYAALGPDEPAAFGVPNRARVDWWENGRRAVRLHQRKAASEKGKAAGLSAEFWGLSASDSPGGYSVPGVYPNPIPLRGARPEFDFSTFIPKDDFGDGTVAPYAAGCSIIFYPDDAVAALRRFERLGSSGALEGLWKEPGRAAGSYGFQDAFNQKKAWVASDCVAIDAGPLVLLIENARTGRIWKLFAGSDHVADGFRRLRLRHSR